VQFLLEAVAAGATLVYDDYGDNDNYENNVDHYDYRNGNPEFGIDDEDASCDSLKIVQTLIAGLPSVLNLNIQTLKDKVEYLRERLGQEELSRALLRCPALLGYSLEGRIKPRLEQMLMGGVPAGKITGAISLKEDNFKLWVKRRLDEASQHQDDDREDDVNETGNLNDEVPSTGTRVVEEGGRIIHWRRE